MDPGSNLYSVRVTLVEPAGWAPPPPPPPQAASSTIMAKPIAEARIRIPPPILAVDTVGARPARRRPRPRWNASLGQHLAFSCGFGITAVMSVPANRAVSGVPYSAAP